MRRKSNPQLFLFDTPSNNLVAKELEQITMILDDTPELIEIIYHDLTRSARHDTGREGMNAEQVLRCCIPKQYRQLTYEELAFHLEDSTAFRRFSRLRMGQYPSRSILHENIKHVTEDAWEAIHRALIDYATDQKIETGKKIRVDSTGDQNRHSSSSRLNTACRRCSGYYPLAASRKGAFNCPLVLFQRPQPCGGKTGIDHSQRKGGRHAKGLIPCFAHLCPVSRGVCRAGGRREQVFSRGFRAMNAAEKLERAIGILRLVIDQTDRRVFKGEKVPASEKVVSFCEDHTDIIVKDRRDTQYSHKVFLSGGVSTMILDCMIERGNPADSDRYRPMLDRRADCFGRMYRQVAADGGSASRDNLSYAKGNQVKDAVFAKKRGLTVMKMAKSAWAYKMLHNFRAGMEAGISTLKRALGLDRCTWSGWEGFRRYVWSSIVSYNLLVMARIKLAKD